MWILLSRRLRAWLILAVAVPVARTLLHRTATRASRRNPNATSTTWLRRADSALARRRTARHRGP
jgi:hypothetical protein